MECLSVIDLSKCRSLGFLPRTLGHLTCLKSLKLSGCSKFSKLPNTLNEITGLVLLDVSGTVMGEVPQSIVHLVKLKELYFRGCKASTSRKSYSPFRWLQWRHQGQIPMGLVLPPSISGLSSLQKLDLGYCNLHDGSFPSDFGSLPSLEILDLSGNHFINLPASTISNLMQLKVLYLDCCPRLKSLPELKQVDMLYLLLYNVW
ncbi:TMV resistance protein N-like [Senna tora]|uniref:TMV resistance protein N-like n=1 Tax=Senna tora TaxID=362788 RepID=A0A834T4D4_9FABA|nr:TMV resistance protein N-like [Senna tora]